MITTEDVVRATGGILLNGDMRISFTGVSTDSRTVKPGELFVALKGTKFDGHQFVLEAFENGAKGAMVSRWPENINIVDLHRALSLIQVEDTLKALGDLAALVRKRFSGRVVAITGSCGKSTTKELLAQILSGHFEVAKNPGNWNNLIGVPLSIFQASDEAHVWVLELATNQPGEIARLAEIVDPDIAVLVSVHPSHLEGLGDLEGVLKEKLALFERAKIGSPLIYPYDQREVRKRVESLSSEHWFLSFGFEEGAEVRARGLRLDRRGTHFGLIYQGEEVEVTLPLLGRHFVLDALAAAAAALALGLSLSQVAEGLSRGQTLSGRLELKNLGEHLLLDDTYNANPASLEAAVEVVKALAGEFSRRIAVIGDMKELGQAAEELHQEAGERLSSVFDHILIVGDHARAVAQGAGSKAEVFSDKETLVERVLSLLDQPSLILVKGSRAMRMEEVIKALEEKI